MKTGLTPAGKTEHVKSVPMSAGTESNPQALTSVSPATRAWSLYLPPRPRG